MILLEILENNKYKEENLEIKIPKLKVARYKKVLDFYKDIFKSMPDLQYNLTEEYKGVINNCTISNNGDDLTEEQKKELLEINVYDLLASMKESEM